VGEHEKSLAANNTSYVIFAHQESGNNSNKQQQTNVKWKKVGQVKALTLPMACTLTQFQAGHT